LPLRSQFLILIDAFSHIDCRAIARTDLEKLRRTRSQIHRQLAKPEPLVTDYRAKLAEVEAGIRAIAPELDLPRRFRDPNPIFRRGELPRVAMAVLREAEGPLPIRAIAVRALAMKGIALPDRMLRRRTRHRLRIILAAFDRRGVTVRVGDGNGAARGLIQRNAL